MKCFDRCKFNKPQCAGICLLALQWIGKTSGEAAMAPCVCLLQTVVVQHSASCIIHVQKQWTVRGECFANAEKQQQSTKKAVAVWEEVTTIAREGKIYCIEEAAVVAELFAVSWQRCDTAFLMSHCLWWAPFLAFLVLMLVLFVPPLSFSKYLSFLRSPISQCCFYLINQNSQLVGSGKAVISLQSCDIITKQLARGLLMKCEITRPC